jgi:hypothetical protein
MADLDPWGSEPIARPVPTHPLHPGPEISAWERLENLDRPQPSMAPRPLRAGTPSGVGALWAAGVPLLALFGAWLFLRVIPCSGKACVVPGAVGWGAGLLALPTAPLAGLPWQSGPVTMSIAAASSVALWIVIGFWSLRRSSDRGTPTAQVLWLGAAVWVGSLTGLLVGTLALAA